MEFTSVKFVTCKAHFKHHHAINLQIYNLKKILDERITDLEEATHLIDGVSFCENCDKKFKDRDAVEAHFEHNYMR